MDTNKIVKKNLAVILVVLIGSITIIGSILNYTEQFTSVSSELENYILYEPYLNPSKGLGKDVEYLSNEISKNPENIKDSKGLMYYVKKTKTDISTGEKTEISEYTNIPKSIQVYKDYSPEKSPNTYLFSKPIDINININTNIDMKIEEIISGYIFIPKPSQTSNKNVEKFVNEVKIEKNEDLNRIKKILITLVILEIILLLICNRIYAIKYVVRDSIQMFKNLNTKIPIILRIIFIGIISLLVEGKSDSIQIFIVFICILMIYFLFTDETFKHTLEKEKSLTSKMMNSRGFMNTLLKLSYIGLIFVEIILIFVLTGDSLNSLMWTGARYLFKILFITFIWIGVSFTIAHVMITRMYIYFFTRKALKMGEVADIDFDGLLLNKALDTQRKIRDNYKELLEETIKSQEMKNELITNVSHDLKTPLTSIINYIEILKKSENCKDDIKEYVDVLSIKADILKTLVDDLFEISKLNSGNIVLKKEKINIENLINQVIGELDCEIKKAEIDIIINFKGEIKDIIADSQLIYRAVNNLLVNVTKYAMKNTRAYIDINSNGDKIEIAIKNITRESMNLEGEDLMERFTRGDSSRNTEGNGLGLAIFNQIVKLHGGECNVICDGDFFKVSFTLNKEI